MNGLALFLRSASRDQRFQSALFEMVDSTDPEMQTWLSTNSGLEVSLSYVLRADNDRASAALQRFMQHIVSSWSSLSPLAGEDLATLPGEFSLQLSYKLCSFLINGVSFG